jgi:hypothetical protein
VLLSVPLFSISHSLSLSVSFLFLLFSLRNVLLAMYLRVHVSLSRAASTRLSWRTSARCRCSSALCRRWTLPQISVSYRCRKQWSSLRYLIHKESYEVLTPYLFSFFFQETFRHYRGSLRQFLQEDKGVTLIGCFGLPMLSTDKDAMR